MIALHDVTLCRGTKAVLRDSFSAGELVWVRGGNGVGKSTLLLTLLGELPVAAGRVDVDGWSAAEVPVRLLPSLFAYVPQTPQYGIGLTVGQVLALFTSSPQTQLLQRLGVAEVLEQSVQELSGGQRQRVALACALQGKARHLLLDEPLASQDPQHRDLVLQVLREAADEGRAVIVTSHIEIPGARTLDLHHA